ncbi:MAG: hypothetical protein D6719_13400 [Candidatus Dadabacteria bacterium]|nr:MAG: hypothetical protein D6719_13400 [Candidatus Dadabacteria bacterium]
MKKAGAIIAIFCLGLACTVPATALAQNVYCAEVMPACDALGNPLAPYDQGPCAAYYARACAIEKARQASNQQLKCEDTNARLKARLRRLLKRRRRRGCGNKH